MSQGPVIGLVGRPANSGLRAINSRQRLSSSPLQRSTRGERECPASCCLPLQVRSWHGNRRGPAERIERAASATHLSIPEPGALRFGIRHFKRSSRFSVTAPCCRPVHPLPQRRPLEDRHVAGSNFEPDGGVHQCFLVDTGTDVVCRCGTSELFGPFGGKLTAVWRRPVTTLKQVSHILLRTSTDHSGRKWRRIAFPNATMRRAPKDAGFLDGQEGSRPESTPSYCEPSAAIRSRTGFAGRGPIRWRQRINAWRDCTTAPDTLPGTASAPKAAVNLESGATSSTRRLAIAPT